MKILGVRSRVEIRSIEDISYKIASSGLTPPTCTCLCAKQAAGIYPHAKKLSKGLSLEQLKNFSEEELRLPEVDFSV